jgi:hypothetical protein
MREMIVIALLTTIMCVYSQGCDRYKAKVDSLMTEFDVIKEKMQDQNISRDEYDDLYSIYADVWAEVVEAQKEQKNCIESQNKTVKVKIEPKRVEKGLPPIFNTKWGSSRQSVKDILRDQKGLKISETDESVLEYKGGSHLGHPVEKWQFSFTNKKLYACQIVYSTEQGMSALKLYEAISAELIKKYGDPSYEKNKFPSSYKDDKIKLSAVKNGSVTIYNKWLFKNDDVLRIGINENGSVMITYLVDSLYKKAK